MKLPRQGAIGFQLALACALLFGCTRDPQVLKKNHFEKGDAYFQQAKYREASIEYQNALQIDSKYADAHYGLAKTYTKQGDWARAYQELQATTTLDPSNLQAQVDLGNQMCIRDRQHGHIRQ